MRRFLHRNKWATSLVVALFMFATSGMSVSRMTCLSSGRSVIDFGLATSCCPDTDSGDQATVKPTCCVFSFAKSDTQDHLPSTFSIALPDRVLPQRMVVTGTEPLARAFGSWLGSRPPPISGHDRLVVFGVQRV